MLLFWGRGWWGIGKRFATNGAAFGAGGGGGIYGTAFFLATDGG